MCLTLNVLLPDSIEQLQGGKGGASGGSLRTLDLVSLVLGSACGVFRCLKAHLMK